MQITRKRVAGYSMIETLVSLLVLALGVIGVAGMQVTTLQAIRESGHGSIALELAEEIAEKMRSNPMRVESNPYLSIDYRAGQGDSFDSDGRCMGGSDCDADALASHDIGEWKSHLNASLPSVRAVVCRDAVPYDAASREYVWKCDGDQASPVVIKLGWKAKDRSEHDAGREVSPGLVLVIDARPA